MGDKLRIFHSGTTTPPAVSPRFAGSSSKELEKLMKATKPIHTDSTTTTQMDP
jgi:hypothetical protein